MSSNWFISRNSNTAGQASSSQASSGTRQRAGFPQLYAAVVLAGLASVGLTGCGEAVEPRIPVFPVEGRVLLGGQPAAGALVVFHPQVGDKDAPRPVAITKPDGSFQLTSYDQADGAPVGDYKITVIWRKLIKHDGEFKPGPNLIPPKFAQPEKSGLLAKVEPKPTKLPDLKLTR